VVVNVKIWCTGIFQNNLNYFSLRNLMEKVHGPVDRVHDGSRVRSMQCIIRGSSNRRSAVKIYYRERVFYSLILAVGPWTNG
jgi:hypothetical protein